MGNICNQPVSNTQTCSVSITYLIYGLDFIHGIMCKWSVTCSILVSSCHSGHFLWHERTTVFLIVLALDNIIIAARQLYYFPVLALCYKSVRYRLEMKD